MTTNQIENITNNIFAEFHPANVKICPWYCKFNFDLETGFNAKMVKIN